MSKSDLSTALFEAIPEDLRAKLGAKFGEFSTLTAPSDVDSATVAMGKMCVEVQNKMLVPLSGLPVADALLYIGALTPPLIAGMFSGLESFASSGPFDIIAPKNGGVYPGFFDAWTVRSEVEALTVTVGLGEAAESFELSRNDDVWSAKWPMPIGDHTAIFSDGTNEQSVNFSVVTYEALEPIVTQVDEDTKEIEFRFELPEGSGVESGEITVTDDSGQTVSLALQIVGTIATGAAVVVSAAGAPVTLTVLGTLAFATQATMLIDEIFNL